MTKAIKFDDAMLNCDTCNDRGDDFSFSSWKETFTAVGDAKELPAPLEKAEIDFWIPVSLAIFAGLGSVASESEWTRFRALCSVSLSLPELEDANTFFSSKRKVKKVQKIERFKGVPVTHEKRYLV